MDEISIVFKTSNKETANEVDNYLANHFRDYINEFRVKFKPIGETPVYDCEIVFRTKEKKILEEIRVEISKLLGRIDDAYSRLN